MFRMNGMPRTHGCVGAAYVQVEKFSCISDTPHIHVGWMNGIPRKGVQVPRTHDSKKAPAFGAFTTSVWFDA